MTTVLSGIKPTGSIHLGNYLGFLRPALELAAHAERCFYFIADYHALNQQPAPEELRTRSYDAAAALLALGLDPGRVAVYRQSDLPEVFELTTALAASAAKGLMNRAHAYKAAVQANRTAGRPDDDGVNMGLYTYPILMAADILVVGADLVPVGRDQAQHVEIARDLAAAFNHVYGPVLRVPAVSDPDVATVVGTDGRKMSKSYDNVIPLFAPRAEIDRLVRAIRTDSRRPEEPKDPATCPVFALYRHLAAAPDVEAMRERYLAGGLAYSDAKAALSDAIEHGIGPARTRYLELRADEAGLDEMLTMGAVLARETARRTMREVRRAVGLGAARRPASAS